MITPCRTPSPSKAFAAPWQHLASLAELDVPEKQGHHSEMMPRLAQVLICTPLPDTIVDTVLFCEPGAKTTCSNSGRPQGSISRRAAGFGAMNVISKLTLPELSNQSKCCFVHESYCATKIGQLQD